MRKHKKLIRRGQSGTITPTLNNTTAMSPDMVALQQQLAAITASLYNPSTSSTSTVDVDDDEDSSGLNVNWQLLGSLTSAITPLTSAMGLGHRNDNEADQMRNQIQSTKTSILTSLGPWGIAAAAADSLINAAGGFSDTSTGLGGVNDAANMAASLLLPGAGWFTSALDDYTVSDTLGSSTGYTGTASANTEVQDGIAGRKILFGRSKAKDKIAKAQWQDFQVSNILNDAKDDLLASNNVQQLQLQDNLQKNASDWMYNIRSGEFGMKIKNAKRIARMGEPMKAGATENPQYLKKGDSTKKRDITQLIAYAKQVNPNFIQRLSEAPRGIKFIDDEGNLSEGSHYLMSFGRYVIPRIQEEHGVLTFYAPEDAIKRALKVGDYLEMEPQEAIDFATNYKVGWPDFFRSFKDGGAINVIPEGALHARKHNLEALNPTLEGNITKKGIPVVSQGVGGEISQQAEIERSEIILNLEVTKTIEDLRKQYNNAKSKAEKDKIAIEAGKILAYEIMENTVDNTGELL